MRLKVLFVVTVMFFAIGGHAQVAIYITSSSARFSNVPTGSALTSGNYQEQYANYWTAGVGGGVTMNFLPLGPVKLGFDLRGSTHPGTTGADTAMAGFRVGLNPPLLRIKPYVEAAGGYVATRTVNISTNPSNPSQTLGGTFENKYAAWEVLGGIDYPLGKFVDLRLVEVGGGKGVGVPAVTGNPSLSMFTVNSGLVVHF